MAEEEEDKGLVEFLKKSAEKATGFLGRFSSGQLYPGQPLIGPKGQVRPGSAPGLTDPVARSIVERERRAKLPDPVRKRIEAGEDALRAPDPVPSPGPVQEASVSERTGLAASEPVLFDSGLVTVQGKSTPAGRALFKSAQEKGQDPNQMIDFYARGLVDENLRVTERGRIFEEIDRTNSLDSILAINDREEGFRLYLEAAESGAVTEWQDRTGAGADTWQQFLDQAVENFLPDAAEVLKLVKGFVPGGATFYDRLVRDSPLGYFGGVAGAAIKLAKGDLSAEEEAELALMKDEYLREGVFRTSASYSNGLVAALTHGPGTKEFYTDRDRALAKYHFWKDQFDVDNMEAGEATAEVVAFGESVKETISDDVSFFDGKATAQEELQDVESAKAKAGQSVQDAVAYLDQLDVVDPQNQPRAEQVRELMLPFSSIASPDVIGSIGLGSAISGAFKMGGKVSRLRKDLTDKRAERRRVDTQLQAAEAAQKKATPPAQAQLAPARMRGPSTADLAKLQNRRTKLDTEIAKLETRIGRIDGTVPGRVAGFIGSIGRSTRSVPLRAAGATASVTGNILQRLGNFVGPVAGAVVAGSALGGAPLGYGVGLLAGRALGLGARGKTLSRFGEKMSRVGQEFSRRRMAYPMFRKFAQEAKTNKLKQYHLGREAAYGLTVGLTAKFAKLWRDAFLGELPFSYVASGGFSQVGGNFLSQAAAESLLIEGPIIGAGKMVGRAAGMQLSGDVKEHNRLAYNAALNFRDQFLTDPDQRAAFDSLPPIVKRMYGNAYTNNPDLKIQFITDLAEGSGLYDPDSNTITINPNDPRGVETILAHEFRHHMDTQGFRQAIIEAAVGPRGFLRQTPANETVQGSGELIPEFKEWAESYNQIRIESGRKPYDLNNPEELGEVVMEWSAYSSMDSVAAGLRNNVLIEWSRRHPWLRSFYDSLLGRFFRKDSLMNAGLLFDQNGNLATQPGLPGMKALKEHPALSARLERMMKDRAGIGFTAEELSDLDDPDSKRKRPSPTAIRKTDTEALGEVQRDMHMDLKTDQQGNVLEVGGVAEIKPEPPPRELLPVLPDKDFDAPKVNEGRGTDNATDLTGALTARADPDADIIPGEETKLIRRDENVEALKAHFREGYGYNDLQLGMIDDLIDMMSDPDRRGEAALGYYFPVWAKQRKKARKGNWKQFVPAKGIDPKWYRFVPYALVQTDVGNVIVKAINMDQVLLNAQTIAKSKKGIEAYQGDVSSLMDDFNEMVRNHGRNIQNAARFTPDKLALLNAVFGDVGRGHKEANLLLQKDPQIQKVRSAVRSFRIERFSQLNSGIKAGFPFSLEKTKTMQMPARDPQVSERFFDPQEPVVSMENMPGMNSGVLQGLHSAKQQDRKQFEDDILEAIADDEFGDVFGRAIGRKVKLAELAASVYVNSEGGIEINDAQQVGGFQSQEEAELYALLRGFFMKQEAVAGNLPRKGGAMKAADFKVGQALDKAGVSKVMQQVQTELEAVGLAAANAEDFAFYGNPEGFSLVHLGFNEDITPEIRDNVFAEVSELLGTQHKNFDTDTFYLDNNWKTEDVTTDYGEVKQASPNGEAFAKEISRRGSALGRSNLLEGVASRVGTRLQKVYDDFANRQFGEPGRQLGVEPAAESVGFRSTLTGRAMIPDEGPMGSVAVARRSDKATENPDLSPRQKIGSDLIPLVAKERGPKIRKAVFAFRDKVNSAVPKFLGQGDLRGITGVGRKSWRMTQRLATNLVDLFNAVPANLVAEWRTWYDRANTWAEEQSKRVYGMTLETVAGMTARMSPGTDWFNNLTMVDHTLQTFEDNPVFTQQMVDHAAQRAYNGYLQSAKGKAATDAERQAVKATLTQRENDVAKGYVGKKFLEVLELDRNAAARIVRSHSELNIGNEVKDETGKVRTGEPGIGRLAWTSYTDIALALDMTRSPNMEAMSLLLGNQHKIRSFYNNIVDPNDITYQDVTVDTHAVGAAHMAPFSQASPEVLANFGTSNTLGTPTKNAASGLSGVYFLYADAYRIAASRLSQQLGQQVLPREVQSVVWEAIRDLYPDSFKRSNAAVEVRKMLDEVPKGNLSMKDAVDQVQDFVAQWRKTATKRDPVKINRIQALSPR